MRGLSTSDIEAMRPEDVNSVYHRLTPEKDIVMLHLPKLPGKTFSQSQTITLEEYRRQESEVEITVNHKDDNE